MPIFILLDEKKKAYFSLSNMPFLDVVRHAIPNRSHGRQPLPAFPCQGRSGFGSPLDKGELEGVLVFGHILFPAHALPRVCGAYLAQGERDTLFVQDSMALT